MVGYGLAAEKQSLEIYAKAPGQRTMIIRPPEGDNVTTIDGASGWIAGPQIAEAEIPTPVLAQRAYILD